MTAFEKALSITLRFEGGYVNNPLDHGGETNKGITAQVYDDYRIKNHLPIRSVKLIGDDEVAAIYLQGYWHMASCDKMPSTLAILVFDFAVNSGPHKAIQVLQRLLNISDDGVVGPKTLAAIASVKERDLCSDYIDARDDFFIGIAAKNHSQDIFLKGWIARTSKLRFLIQ